MAAWVVVGQAGGPGVGHAVTAAPLPGPVPGGPHLEDFQTEVDLMTKDNNELGL